MSKALNLLASACAALLVTACGGGQSTSTEQLLGTATVAGTNAGDVVRLSAGDGHSVGLRSDGMVFAWGRNDFGQLGNGRTTVDSASPIMVPGLSAVRAITAGATHTMALTNDGRVWTWGNNSSGQLGLSYASTVLQATAVPGMSHVVAIAAGTEHSVALTAGGLVWGWGSANARARAPRAITGLSSVVDVAAGGSRTLALKSDGTVWTWDAPSITPSLVVGLSDVKALSASIWHSLALKRDGTVWAWGMNMHGQLGNPDVWAGWSAPRQVAGMSGIKAIAAGPYNSVAVHAKGTAYAWGNNSFGQLGSGSYNYVPNFMPSKMMGVGDAVTAASGTGYVLLLTSDGAVFGSGLNVNGQLGVAISKTPVLLQARGVGGAGHLNLGKSTGR